MNDFKMKTELSAKVNVYENIYNKKISKNKKIINNFEIHTSRKLKIKLEIY